MPGRGTASGTIPGTAHGRVPPFYPPSHQHLALLYWKVFLWPSIGLSSLRLGYVSCCYGISEYRDQEASNQSKWLLWFFFPPPSLMSGLSDTSGIVWCYGDTTLLCYRNCSVRSGRCGWGEAGDLDILQEGPADAGCLGRDKALLCFLVESWPGLSDSECGHGRFFILYYIKQRFEKDKPLPRLHIRPKVFAQNWNWNVYGRSKQGHEWSHPAPNPGWRGAP